MPATRRGARIRLLLPAVILACLAGCKPPEEASVKALVGAVLIDGSGGPPVSNSVLLITGPTVAEAGARTGIAIPQGAEEIDGSKQFLVPVPIDVCQRNGGEAYSLAGGRKIVMGVLSGQMTADQAKSRIADARAQRRSVVLLDGLSPAAEEAAVELARQNSLRVLARISKLADAQRLVAEGVSGLIGMIMDAEPIDPSFVARVRDLRVVWAPALVECDAAALDRARRNTLQLAQGGVAIAVAGAPLARELELLVSAGISPGEALVAATRNGAQALGMANELGTLQPGKRADLFLLPANPIEDIRNLSLRGREMQDGVWLK